MKNNAIHDINIESQSLLITPQELKQEIPASALAYEQVAQSRQTIKDILDGKDKRLFVVVGPCSIHDPNAALDYATRLKALADELSDTLYIVMRVYFEKPRTTVGWKGLINDPHLNDSFQIEDGLRLGRRLLLDILESGLPTATEALDPISPQYLQDLISWSAIGARTTESQTHREMASGLSGPVGFKNGTDGGVEVATNAIKSATKPHRFLGLSNDGRVSVVTTRGNAHAHVVLRGGSAGPNYDSVSVGSVEEALKQATLPLNIMIDCSHANSNKDPEQQVNVLNSVANQINAGNTSIVGLMIESHINPGQQSLKGDPKALAYGVSITDGCIGWETTERALHELRQSIRAKLAVRRLPKEE